VTSTCKFSSQNKGLNFGPVAKKFAQKRQLTLVNFNQMPIFVNKIRVSQPVCNGVASTATTLKLVPLKAIDIPSCRVKRNYENENKTFTQNYSPEDDSEDQDGTRQAEGHEFMISPNSIVHFHVEIDNPLEIDSTS